MVKRWKDNARNNNETNVNSLSLVSRVYESAPFEYILFAKEKKYILTKILEDKTEQLSDMKHSLVRTLKISEL